MARYVHLQSLLSTLASRTLLSLSPRVQSGICQHQIATSQQGRRFSLCHVLRNSSKGSSPTEDNVTIHFVNQDGVTTTTSVAEGVSLLNVVMNKKIEIDGFGACSGTLSCSTCHLVFEENIFNKMEPVLEDEVDMLDLSYGLTKTSRLGCQVCVQKWMDGMTVQVPKFVKDQKMARTGPR